MNEAPQLSPVSPAEKFAPNIHLAFEYVKLTIKMRNNMPISLGPSIF